MRVQRHHVTRWNLDVQHPYRVILKQHDMVLRRSKQRIQVRRPLVPLHHAPQYRPLPVLPATSSLEKRFRADTHAVPASCRIRCALLFALAFAATAGAQQPLTSIRAVRSLTSDLASQGKPVHLHGVVTAISGWKNSFFLQDGTVSISVDRPSAEPILQAGQRVIVDGVTAPGSFAPIIQASRVTAQGMATLPTPAPRRADELIGGRQDSQRIMIRGTVQSQKIQSIWNHDVFTLNVDIGSGLVVAVRIREFDPVHLPLLTGAFIRIAGVCGTKFNDRRQFVGVQLYTPTLASLTVLRPPPPDPFNRPVQALDSLLRFTQLNASNELVRVAGTVTWQKPGSAFYLQSGNIGLFVDWKESGAPPVGSRVEVVGHPATGHGSTHLRAVFVRSPGIAAPVVARRVQASQVITTRDGFTVTPDESLLVQIDGKLLESSPGARATTLLLENDHTLFTVNVPTATAADLTPGAILRVSGICTINYDDYSNEPSAFSLQIRSPADIIVLHPAPWWNATHAAQVVEVLACVVILLLASILLLRQTSLRALANTDSLTGLCNRRALLYRLENARRDLRPAQSLLVLFIDVDHFKQINDRYGHHQGDLALQQVARLLRQVFPASLVTGRIGGDEFVVILRSVDAHQCQTRIETALAEHNRSAGGGIPLSLSTGILTCVAGQDETSTQQLLERADQLMYASKRAAHATEISPLAAVIMTESHQLPTLKLLAPSSV